MKELFHSSAERHSARTRARVRCRRGRQVAPRLGVLQVHRRPGRDRPLARGAVTFIGEGVSYWALVGDGPRTAPRSARRTPGVVAERLRDGPRALDPGPVRPGVHRPPARPAARPADSEVLAKEELFSGWRLFFDRLAEHFPSCSSSRTCSGPTPAWSSSWTTCSSGRATTPSSSSCCRGRREPTAKDSGSLADPSRPSRWTRFRRGHRRAAGRPRHRPSHAARARIVEAPRGSRFLRVRDGAEAS